MGVELLGNTPKYVVEDTERHDISQTYAWRFGLEIGSGFDL